MAFFAIGNGPVSYASLSVLLLLIPGLVLLIASFIVRPLRRNFQASAKALSKYWPTMLTTFGLLGIVLGVCRAEGIAFLSMPFLGALWGVLAIVILVLQTVAFRRRSYTIIPAAKIEDPRDAYLPKKKKH